MRRLSPDEVALPCKQPASEVTCCLYSLPLRAAIGAEMLASVETIRSLFAPRVSSIESSPTALRCRSSRCMGGNCPRRASTGASSIAPRRSESVSRLLPSRIAAGASVGYASRAAHAREVAPQALARWHPGRAPRSWKRFRNFSEIASAPRGAGSSFPGFRATARRVPCCRIRRDGWPASSPLSRRTRARWSPRAARARAERCGRPGKTA